MTAVANLSKIINPSKGEMIRSVWVTMSTTQKVLAVAVIALTIVGAVLAIGGSALALSGFILLFATATIPYSILPAVGLMTMLFGLIMGNVGTASLGTAACLRFGQSRV